ncbi:MAG: sigma-70 family RNA polymerase sigma factor [Planctomycetota bacterium]
MLRPLNTTPESVVDSDAVNPEIELIQKAKSGCSDSLTILVRSYHLELRHFLTRRTGDASVADDLAQEVFIAAFRQIGRLKDNSSFRSWLLKIARNKSIDHLRRVSRDRQNRNQLIEFTITRQCASKTHQTNPLETNEIRKTLTDCIAKLGPHARNLIRWFYFDNETAESIARRMNQKANAVRMSMLRTRRTLAKCIRRNTEIEL